MRIICENVTLEPKVQHTRRLWWLARIRALLFTTVMKSLVKCVPNMVEGSKQMTELPSQKIDRNLSAHLTPKQQQELLQLLDKYADRFSEIPGLTTRAEHCVELMPGFKPKRMRAYKVPEKLQPEVERQLQKWWPME